jgi:MFS family permease
LVAYTTIPHIPVHKIALQPILKSLKEGFNFVYSQKIILGALSLDLMAVLFGGVTAILPMFVDEILNGGPQMLGILRAAPSLGAIITAIIVTRKAPLRHSGSILYLFIALYGVCILLFGLSRSFFACFICLLLSGAFDNVSVLIRSTIMQLMTPDHIRGRVASINGIFIGSSNEIGAFESGLAARLLGLIPSILFGGFMTLGIVMTLYNVFPALRKLSLEDYIEKEKLM